MSQLQDRHHVPYALENFLRAWPESPILGGNGTRLEQMFRRKLSLLSILTGLAIIPGLTSAQQERWGFDSAPVGQVVVLESRAQCGGTLVGADVVLTAAHCIVPTGGTGPVQPSTVRFAMQDGRGPMRIFQVVDIAYPPGFIHEAVPTRQQISRDVALLRLSEFAGRETDDVAAMDTSQDYVALLPASEDDSFAGEPCRATYENDEIMVLACSRDEGASGSPVYSLIEGRRKLVGVISADGRLGDQSILFAVNPIPVLEELRWVSETVPVSGRR